MRDPSVWPSFWESRDICAVEDVEHDQNCILLSQFGIIILNRSLYYTKERLKRAYTTANIVGREPRGVNYTYIKK